MGFYEFIICFVAGIAAGLGTGFAGMSAAAAISPLLITFLGMPAYEAVGIALASICGFVGAGGGMMMLLVLTTVLGYELKTAVGTSVFVMSFTAFTGAVSHFALDGMPDIACLVVCILSTLLWARVAAKIANKANPLTLNRVTGVILILIGVAIFAVNLI